MTKAKAKTKTKTKQAPPPETIPADSLMIIAAFRYCLGRQTYIVRDCTDWVARYWNEMPKQARTIIARDLDEAFADDDRDRANGSAYKRLGWECDRAAWNHVRRLYRRPHCVQCDRKELPDAAISVVHVDGEVSCTDCNDNKCIVCREPFRTGETIVPVMRKARHPGCLELGASND